MFVIVASNRISGYICLRNAIAMNLIQQNYIKPGDGLVRSKSFFGLIDHYGLYVGQSMVIENHPLHGVRLITLAEFFQGRQLLRVKRFPGNEWSRRSAVDKAYKMVGTRYDVFDFNCEHFVNHIHELGVKSSQADAVKGLIFGLLAIGFVAAISED